MLPQPLRQLFRGLWRVVRDPALYVTAFTFYAGMNRWITPVQLALCYGGTVLVMVLHHVWSRRHWEGFDFAEEVRSGMLWGSSLFAIGFAWGVTCGYILEWMGRVGEGFGPAA